MALYDKCPDCGDENGLIIGVFNTISVPKLTEDRTACVWPRVKVRLKLQCHRARVPFSVFAPTGRFNGDAEADRKAALK